jgi:hypothetical protein
VRRARPPTRRFLRRPPEPRAGRSTARAAIA